MNNQGKENTRTKKINFTNKLDCSLYNQCQITNIIYKAKITSNLKNYHTKIYYRTSHSTFKLRYVSHKKSFHYKNAAKMQ